MLLCLDSGNSDIHGGVFEGETLRCQFRKSTHPLGSADELGVFFSAVLRENGVDPRAITQTAICSVVPAAVHALRRACSQYFRSEPFILEAGVKTGLKIRYKNPLEVGADRIANAIAARHRKPDTPLLVVDCGTATTFDVITGAGDYLGGAIMPGIGVAAQSLASHTAKLSHVEIARPIAGLGRTTTESIQAGLYYGQVGAIRLLLDQLTREAFPARAPWIIGTGGFASLFEREELFSEIVPELVLQGLRQAVLLNQEPGRAKP
jgi:type III pantothenate kinase